MSHRKIPSPGTRRTYDLAGEIFRSTSLPALWMAGSRITRSNPAARRWFGCRASGLIRKSLAAFSPSVQAGGQSSEALLSHLLEETARKGTVISPWLFTNPVGGPRKTYICLAAIQLTRSGDILCLVDDTTDPGGTAAGSRLDAELKLIRLQEYVRQLEGQIEQYRENERIYNQNREIYSLAIEATGLGIYDTRVKDEDLHLKENWMVRLGHDPRTANEDEAHWESLIHPDDYTRATGQFQRAVRGEIDAYTMEYRLRAADGSWRWIIESSKVIEKYPGGSPPRIVGTHFDITQRKQAEEAEREQRAFAEALSDTAALLNSTLDINKVLDLILANAGRVVPHDGSDIWLTSKDQDTVYLAQRKGPGRGIIQPSTGELPVADIDLFSHMVKTRLPVIIPVLEEQPGWLKVETRQVRSLIVTPIPFGDKLLGFLVLLSSRPAYFTSVHVARLQAFTNQAAVAIRNAQLYRRAQEVAALEERQRLAREMHDVISQTLFSATLKAEVLPYLFDMEQPEAIRQNLVELYRLTRGALAEMRTMLMELRPGTIVHTEMANLLQQLADGLAGRTTIEVALTTRGHGLLPPEVQTALFRITQEAFNNLVKHSHACKVALAYSNRKDFVELTIQDDGCGFDPGNLSPERMGVRIMQERAESIGASFSLSSNPGQGTSIHVKWNKVEKAHG